MSTARMKDEGGRMRTANGSRGPIHPSSLILPPCRTVTILVGDVREKLAELPEKSVHCVVTSPPYWGLRDYGTPPQVWGGDAACEHEWGPLGPGHHPGQVEQTIYQNPEAARKGQNAASGQRCRKCNAWLGNLGLEPTVELYVEHMVQVFREVWRVLRDDGTLWLNMGDCYNAGRDGGHAGGRKGSGFQQVDDRYPDRTGVNQPGLKPKDLVMQPARVALALQADGWYLRCDIIWAKPNPMPESCRDRPTKSHEYVFLMTKKPRYFFDQEAVREKARYGKSTSEAGFRGGSYVNNATFDNNTQQKGATNTPGKGGARNIRSVWTIPTQPFPEAHFATFPEKLVTPCIKAGTSEKGCCPACGASWMRVVEKTGGTIGKGWHEHEGDDAKDFPSQSDYQRKTTGWKPSCECEAPAPVPCTVLDPFGGSGTTGLVAAKLGRKAILVELNPEYAEMARRRTNIDVQTGIFQV